MAESCMMGQVEGPQVGGAAWILVIPVKRTAIAKSRLAGAFPRHRQALARAFAVDTTAAALRTAGVSEVVVITDDAAVADDIAELGARVVPDEPDAGLNPALGHAADLAMRSGHGVAALSADLPALRPDELAAVLRACARRRSFVADTGGTGTTLLGAPDGEPLDPRFGRNSATAHLVSGAAPVELPGIDSVRRDVDTPADLAHAVRLGVGPRTATVLGSTMTSPPAASNG
jgi:2-phospho-L-lactate/phosphoenolpyruvate guanylyltransferase